MTGRVRPSCSRPRPDATCAPGRRSDARRAAEASVRGDTTSARAVACLADAVGGGSDRLAATALEGGIDVVGPRAEWSGALVEVLESLADGKRLVTARKRWVALRPGDRPAVERLLSTAAAIKDADQLTPALAWLLSQPQPVSWAGPVLGQALRALADIDPAAAAVVARRALDVYGPRVTALRVAMLVVADRAGDDAFAAAVLERWLPFCPESPERIEIHVRLAALQRSLGIRRARRGSSRARCVRARRRRGRLCPRRAAGGASRLTRCRGLDRHGRGRTPVDGPRLSAAACAWRDRGRPLGPLRRSTRRPVRVGASRERGALRRTRHAYTRSPGLRGVDFAFHYLVRLIDSEPDDRTAAKSPAT